MVAVGSSCKERRRLAGVSYSSAVGETWICFILHKLQLGDGCKRVAMRSWGWQSSSGHHGVFQCLQWVREMQGIIYM